MIDIQKEKLSVNKIISQKKDIIFVEGDMIVPDSKPDILNTICTSGVVSIYKKETQEGKVRIDGAINTYIMYMPEGDEDNTRGINTTLDFSENINVANCSEGMQVVLDSKIKTIEAKVINGRKIGIKATLEITLKVYTNEDIELINDIENQGDIQILKENLKVNSLLGMSQTKIYGKDNIAIDNMDNLAEILKAEICIVDKDIKISYNKVLAKSEADVKIMYLTEDNRINTINNKIPIVGFIDMPNVSEGNLCDVNYEIKNIIIKPNSQEEHSIYVEIEIEIMCHAYEEKEINLIQDMYSITKNVKLEKIQIQTMTDKQNVLGTKSIRENISMQDMQGMNLIDVDITSNIINETKINSKILYEAELNIKFIFEDSRKQIIIKNEKVSFDYTIENLQNGESLNSESDIEIKSKDFIIQNDGSINCSIDLQTNTNLYRMTNLNMIDKIEDDEERDEQDYSVVIYIVKKGDTLWNIAKEFGSTVDGIARVNGIENRDLIVPGQKLYIPKFEKIMEINYE